MLSNVVWVIFFCFMGLVHGNSPWHNTNCVGNRRAMVHLFEWRWQDVALECERFLGPMGFCGVQVSPPAENAIVDEPDLNRPWWERYQPISYDLVTRSGDEEAFQDMVQRCNAVDVRIYVDLIINHMSGMGRSGVGTGGSDFDTDEGHFPGVPYVMSNFNGCDQCPACCCVNDWQDEGNVRDCRLYDIIDLDQKNPDTQDKIVGYIDKLTGYGVAGFRVDAAKHMWPEDMLTLWGRLQDLNTNYFPSGSKPYMALEVIDMNEEGEIRGQEYAHLGRVTDFRYCDKIKDAESHVPSLREVYDPDMGMLVPEDAFVFVDNHDNQRGHGAGGDVLTHKRPYEYKKAVSMMMAYTHGHQRIMSSFFFEDTEESPPHDDDMNTLPVIINPDGSCGNGWVCEHRWGPIAGMASFAKAASEMDLQNWWEDGNQIAFSRGDRAFFAITNHGGMDETLQTGLPAGDYCNVLQGCATSTGCTGQTITVNGDGTARIQITDGSEPMLAIHVEARAGSDGCIDDSIASTSPTLPTTTTTPVEW